MALVEQTRCSTGQFTDDAIVLFDGLTHTEVRYAPNPELVAYVARFQKDEAVQLARFTLELAPENKHPG